MEKLQQKLFKEMNELHEEAEFRRGHGLRDHTFLVASNAVSMATQTGMSLKDIVKSYISGLMHDIIQPEQVMVGSDIERMLINRFGYDGQGSDDNEERESARFANHYLNQASTIKLLNSFGVDLTKGDISDITAAILTTAGKMNPETGLFELNGETGSFKDLDRLSQITYLGDKLSGAAPNMIFNASAKVMALYAQKGLESSIYQFVIDKFVPHIKKRDRFFSEVLKNDRIGTVYELNETNRRLIENGMSLQKEFVEQIGKETEHDIMYGRVGQLFTCMRMIELANTMIREKISEGDVRGIDGFDLIQEFYARKMHMAPNPGEAACTNLKNCAFTEYINDSLQDQRRMGTAIEKTLIPHSDYTPF